MWRTIDARHYAVSQPVELDLRVYNAATRRGMFGPREGWRYAVELRSGNKFWPYGDDGPAEPPVEQWGTDFSVKKLAISVDLDSGELLLSER